MLVFTLRLNCLKTFHRTILDEFYRTAFGKKMYNTLDQVQEDLDIWIKQYNAQRPHWPQPMPDAAYRSE